MMLSKDECKRRVLALLTMPPAERPITVFALADLTGLERKRLYYIAGLELSPALRQKQNVGNQGMTDATQRALSKALLWLENGQVENGAPAPVWRGKKPPVRVAETVAPPCKLVRRFRFDEKGFRIEPTWVNPLAFPPD